MISNLQENKPVVLAISESGNKIRDLLIDYLKITSLEVKTIDLDEDFFLNYKKIAGLYSSVYKIIFIYGFNSYNSGVYEKTFSFLEEVEEKSSNKIPLILISSFSNDLEILGDSSSSYDLFLATQRRFLNNFYEKFNNSQIFLAQDLLLDSNKISYPLLLFFSAFKRGYLINPQEKFYFQDEKSFFDLIKKNIIKPHRKERFLLKGRSIQSAAVVKKIAYLFEQYFQKKLIITDLISSPRKDQLLEEFSFVSNSKCNIEQLIDQKIRHLLDSKKNIEDTSLSEAELRKALEKTRLYRKQLKKKNQAQKGLGKTGPQIDLKAKESGRNEATQASESGVLETKLDAEIEKLFSSQRSEEKTVRHEKNLEKGQKILKKKKKRKLLFWLGSLSFGLSLFFLVLFSLFNLSKSILEKELLNTLSSEGENIEKIDKSIVFRFFKFQMWQYEKLFSEESLSEALDVRNLEEMLIKIYEKDLEINQKSYNIYSKTISGGENLDSDYQELITNLQVKEESLRNLNSYSSSLNLDLYQEEEKEIWQKTIDLNRESMKETIQSEQFLSAFKDLILKDGRVHLLLLSQDSSELRSTGGFLSEISILTFERGVLMDQQVMSVDEIDGMVYGHKEAPQEIKDFLGEDELYLRDSNWSADFTESAREITWFVEQANGKKIDLLVALNTKIYQDVLEIFDGLTLNNSVINKDNYLERQEERIFNDYDSKKNQGFSWQLSNSLLSRLTSLDELEFISLKKLFIKQLNQRELMIYSFHQDLQSVLKNNSWSGERLSVSCPSGFNQENCLTDFIFQVENNVGINKVNPYIEEVIEHNIGISDQFIRHKLSIKLKNQATSSTWPMGVYRDFLKFYLNSQASLEKVELNAVSIDPSKLSNQETDYGREVSMFLEIPEQSSVKLDITYLIPNQVEAPFSYVFLDQKQPGVFNKKTSYNIVFDDKFKPQLIAPSADYQDKVIHFENDNSDHFLFAVDFD